MLDLELKKTGLCLLCRQPVNAADHKLCEDTLQPALKFVSEYYCGLMERYNFDVLISVRGAKLVYLGHPSKKPKLPKKIAVF